MNSFWNGFEGQAFVLTQALRDQMMATLTDADLAYTPSGENPTLGELCREIGGIEYTYIQSFKTLNHDWTYPTTEPGLATSVEKLQTWFKALDDEFNTLLADLSDEELNRPIVRGISGRSIPERIQPYVYREALYIFYGRASVYLRALRKPLSQQWQDWIGE